MPRTLVGVGFTWNIFDGLNREANIRQTRLTKQTLQLGREKAQNELGVLVDKLYSEIQNAKDDVAALNTTIEMSRELVRIRKKSFQEGMATSTDVIDAERCYPRCRLLFCWLIINMMCTGISALYLRNAESFGSIAVPDKPRTLYSGNNKKRKQYGKREETVRSRFYRCSCGHCYGVCHWDYSYEQ